MEQQGACVACTGAECAPTVWDLTPVFTIREFTSLNGLATQAARTGQARDIAERIRTVYGAAVTALADLQYETHVTNLVIYGSNSAGMQGADVQIVDGTSSYEALRQAVNTELTLPSALQSVRVHEHTVRYVVELEVSALTRVETCLLYTSDAADE